MNYWNQVIFKPRYFKKNKEFQRQSPISDLILEKQVKLTFIAYFTSKFFAAKSINNTDSISYTCNENKQLNPYIMKVVPIKNIKPRDDLITLIYEQDEVIHF